MILKKDLTKKWSKMDFPTSQSFKKTPGLTLLKKENNGAIIYSPLLTRLYFLKKIDFNIFSNLNNTVTSNKVTQKYIDSLLLVPSNIKMDYFFSKVSKEKRNREEITILFPKNCNLDCKYCYLNQVNNEGINLEAIKKIIDQSEEKQKGIDVIFHGGEPSLYLDEIKKIINYLKNRKIKGKTFIQTNGVMDLEKLDYLSQEMDSLAISTDGPPKIQDKQRPLKGGGKSSKIIERNLNYLDKMGIDYTINSVVTNHSVNQLKEILEHFHTEYNPKNVNFQGMVQTEKSSKENLSALNMKKYRDETLRMLKFAYKEDLNVKSDLLYTRKPGKRYCGFSGPMNVIHPNGEITSCYEMTPENELPYLAHKKYNSKKKEFDSISENKEFVQSVNLDNMPQCQDCYLKWSCRGFCPAKNYRLTGSFFKKDELFCKSIKEVNRDYLIFVAKNEFFQEG